MNLVVVEVVVVDGHAGTSAKQSAQLLYSGSVCFLIVGDGRGTGKGFTNLQQNLDAPRSCIHAFPGSGTPRVGKSTTEKLEYVKGGLSDGQQPLLDNQLCVSEIVVVEVVLVVVL